MIIAQRSAKDRYGFVQERLRPRQIAFVLKKQGQIIQTLADIDVIGR